MKAIVIGREGIQEVTLATESDGSATLQGMYQHLECSCLCSGGYIDIPGREPHAVWADDEAFYSSAPTQVINHVKWYPEPLIGNLLVTGISENGETTPCTLTVEEVKSQVRLQGMVVRGNLA